CRVGLEYELPDGRTIRVDRDLVAHKGAIAELRETGPQVQATALGDIAQLVREHTGCDEALFRATLLVRHEGVEIGDADDLTRSLSERIEVLVSGSPGGISAARAVRKLEEKVKGLSGPRAGEITQAEARLRDAESRLASGRRTAVAVRRRRSVWRRGPDRSGVSALDPRCCSPGSCWPWVRCRAGASHAGPLPACGRHSPIADGGERSKLHPARRRTGQVG